MSPAGSCMNRLPQVFVFHVSADVVVKEKIDHLDVAVGSSNVQLEKRFQSIQLQ